MRLEQLQQIVTINQCHSVSRAAEKLFMTQPALSRSVSKLEKELKVNIFARTAYGVEVTDIGELVVDQAERILHEVGRLNEIVQARQTLKGNIYIAVAPTFYNMIIAQLVVYFRENYPQVNLVVKERSATSIVNDVCSGYFDIGITGYPLVQHESSIKKFEKKNLRYQSFKRMQFKLFVSIQNPISKLPNITMEQISHLPTVEYKSNWHAIIKELGFELDEEPLIVYDRETLKKIVASDKAVAILPEFFGVQDPYFDEQVVSSVPIVDCDDIVVYESYFLCSALTPLTELKKVSISMINEIYDEMIAIVQ